MRTSYNRENNKDISDKDEKSAKIEIPEELKTDLDTSENTNDTQSNGVSVDKILNALENKSIEKDDLRLSLDEQYDIIFSDGKSDAITTDFYKISNEIEEALEEDRISRIEDECEDECEDLDEDLGAEVLDLGIEGVLDDTVEEEIDLNEKEATSSEDVEDVEQAKTKSTKSFNTKKIVASSVAVVVIVAGVTVGYRTISNRNSVEGLEKQITKLYTSSKKDDLKSTVNSNKIDKYYVKLDELKDNEDTKSIRSELDTISAYIADKDILDEINSSGYDLNSSDMQSKLDKVNISSLNYSVPSLADSISSTIRQITEDYNYFISLRDELSLVSDYSNFDIKGYQLQVNEVTHTVNKKELQDKLDAIAKSMKLSETVEDIKKESSEKIDEAVDKVSSSFSEKMSELSDSIKELIPNMINAIKDFLSGKDSQGN